MKKLVLTTIAFAMSVPSYGQSYGDARRRAAEQDIISRAQTQAQLGMAEGNQLREWNAEDWKRSQKLTVLDKVPDSPHEIKECLSITDLRDGDVGYLDCWHAKVMQISSQTEIFLVLVNQYSNEINCLWLKDYPTKGLADKDKVRLVGLVKVDGTKSYLATDNSQKTVRVLRFLTKAELQKIEDDAKRAAEEKAKLEAERKAQLAKEEAKQAAAEEALYRTWTDSTGKKKMVAKFLFMYDGKNVGLWRKNDNKATSVRFSQLSQEDQQWIRDQKKIKNDIKLPDPETPSK